MVPVIVVSRCCKFIPLQELQDVLHQSALLFRYCRSVKACASRKYLSQRAHPVVQALLLNNGAINLIASVSWGSAMDVIERDEIQLLTTDNHSARQAVKRSILEGRVLTF